VGSKNHEMLVFFTLCGDRVKTAQRLVYFIALTDLSLNNSLDWLPAYFR
jgi:hypothetical protein